MTDADAIALHEGRFQALAALAARGEWATVRAWLAHADPDDATTYRQWLKDAGHHDPEETLKP